MNQPKTSVSFEYFPPKSDEAADSLWGTVEDLAALGPKFMTVTYGAGGSTREGTLQTLKDMHERTGVDVAGHLTFINSPVCDLKELTDSWWESGIRHIVALRGDMPEDLSWPLDTDKDYFQFTSEFVRTLKLWHPFEITVGAYPEKHPDAPSMSDDLKALRNKCNAGADRAVTQFFFDNTVFYRFRDECLKTGITTPIFPGLLPIHNYDNMCRFAERCQATVPEWVGEKFKDSKDREKLARDLLIEQVSDLVANDVEHIHFYTLNKSDITREACQAIGY